MQTGDALTGCGPALVTAVADRDVEVQLPTGSREWARLAIPAVYQPCAGDVVLVLSTSGAAYVIGVLEGHGPSVLQAPGDLELRAPEGEIRIVSSRGYAVTAHEISLQAATIDLVGDTLCEEFQTIRRRVSDAIDVRVQSISVMVGETYRLMARRILGRGQDSITLDAPAINLG